MKPKFDLSLYLVTDSSYHEEPEFLRRVEAACRGGVTLVQLREKNRTSREYYELACKVKAITDRYEIPLIIDDRVDIAQACGAAGVHLGAADLPVSVARKILGPDYIIGATAKTVPWALDEKAQGADYLGGGAMFPTATKVTTVLTPVTTLADIIREVQLPVAAIGGLDAENCGVLEGIPVDGIAVVRALMLAEDPEQAARKLRSRAEELRQIKKGE
ncbi:MAG: thiamine phosphate synthase [Clostridiales bacterium]|nr:thiamine phosphate synthase [Clostridiales bacterium]